MPSFIEDRLKAAAIRSFSLVDDGDTGLVVQYIGSQASGTVEVSSAGDITFKHGALGAEAVDSTIDSGGDDAGVIDVSDANANTFGEVVDLINASANWRAYLVDVLRSDSSNASTGSLLTKSATQAKLAGGVELYKDTSKVLNLSKVIMYNNYPDDAFRKDSAKNVSSAQSLDKISEIIRIVSTNTFGSGTSLIQIHEVDRITGASTKVWEKAGGATTVEQDLDLSDGGGRGVASRPGKKLLVRLVGSAACTGSLNVSGRVI